MKGIFKVADERASICVNGAPDGARPTEFSSSDENGYMLIEVKKSTADSN